MTNEGMEILTSVSSVMAASGHRVSLRETAIILSLWRNGSQMQAELVDDTGMYQSLVSQVLKTLRAKGLVDIREMPVWLRGRWRNQAARGKFPDFIILNPAATEILARIFEVPDATEDAVLAA